MLIIKITLQHIDFLQFFFLISIDSLQSDENFSNRQTILILLNYLLISKISNSPGYLHLSLLYNQYRS